MNRKAQPDFRSNQLFRGVPERVLARVTRIPDVAVYEAEEIIFDESDPADFLYLIGSGTVRISKRGRGAQQETLAYLGEGNFFGEMAVYDPAPRSARATAAERTQLGRIDERAFEKLLTAAPKEIGRNVTQAVIHRLRGANAHLIQEVLEAERLSLVGSMTSSIIHDLKNPMGVITNAAELLAEREGDPLLLKLSGMIRRSADRVLVMVQELLDYSRGTAQLSLNCVAVEHLLEELDDQVLHGLSRKGIQVERQIAYSGNLQLDRDRFVRVLMNLIKNAVEAMPSGGALSLCVSGERDYAVFTVADTGHGIPEHILPTIFEPFVTHGKAQGTGLGMAIAKSIVEAHGGSITVASTSGEGTCFTIRVPRGADTAS